MHCLYGLQQLGLTFELKGGTSLSKGFQIIHRFSEDIDVRIEPPADMDVKVGKNQTKPAHVKSRADFYDWLTKKIVIDGITSVARDTSVDNKDMFSAGIRLHYKNLMTPVKDLREGVLLEAGFRQGDAERAQGYQLMGLRLRGGQGRDHRQSRQGRRLL